MAFTNARQLRAKWIGEQLDQRYPGTPIPLIHQDPFTLLVAVVLSAQCTDARVNQVTPGLFAKAPDAPAMAALDELTILELIKSCGLAPKKAKAIKELSRLICTVHGGAVPRTLAELEALPGVGHKTASVMLVQAFDTPAFPVDTHIHRLATRWGLSSGKNVVQTETDLKALYPAADWGRRHLQFIYFGREHCKARGHVVADCPLCGVLAKTPDNAEKIS